MIEDPSAAAAGNSAAAGWVSALGRDVERAGLISRAVSELSGVAALSSGEYGRLGTFGAGREVPGVCVDDQLVRVHIIALYGISLHSTASDIRAVALPWLDGRTLEVTVEDILLPGENLEVVRPTREDPIAQADASPSR